MKPHILSSTIRYALLAPLALAVQVFAENPLPEIRVDDKPLQRNEHTSFAPIIEKVSPSVVTIDIKGRDRGLGNRDNPMFDDPFFRRFFGIPEAEKRPKKEEKKPGRLETIGVGSGVIVSPDGFIITNNHVVAPGEEIVVTLSDGKTEYKAKKIGNDPGSDIAVIKIEAKNLPPVTFANSDTIKVGDIAIAIGNPFALRQTVTQGIISATGRNKTGIADFANFIQTDAAINPGNSGGALVDAQGRLIGINSAIFSQSGGNMGIGFAVPSNQARTVMESLIKHGKVMRGFLGIQMQEVDEKLAKSFNLPDQNGVLVAEVVPEGGAQKGGIKNGDVIVALNGKRIEDMAVFRDSVASMPPGTKVKLQVVRNGKSQDMEITLAERPNGGVASAVPLPEPAKEPDVLDGVTVSEISADMRRQFGIPEDLKGAIVTNVDPDSPCADAGIKPGDVIVDIDGSEVKSADDAVKISEKVKTKASVRVRVSTRGVTRFVIVEEPKDR